MGARGRSIRLRIYFLVAIPLITMLGVFGVVAYTSITTWLNLDRAPNLINATSVPITQLVNLMQAERRAAVVYLSHPDANNLRVYQTAVAATQADMGPLNAALNSGGTKSSENAQETAAIGKLVADVNGLSGLRQAVQAHQVTPLLALGGYTNVILDAPAVFQSEAKSLTDTTAASAGLGLIQTVNSHEDLAEQDAVLAGALAAGSLTPQERYVFAQAAGRQQDATGLFTKLFSAAENTEFTTTLNQLAPQAVQNKFATLQQAVEGGATIPQLRAQGLNSAGWQQITATMVSAHYRAGLAAAAGTLANDRQIVNSYKTRVYVIGAAGAAGLILTLIVTILLARSINRRLTRLRRAALTLAEKQLPAVVARLRRGESVDVAAEAPPLRAGSDEIGQVGQAIDTVRQTAIRSAVEEARLRQGLNDVFRNLARRSQSLLQRQLTVLDGMERRATDPDVLEDLFKMDHLTTRMRRHAEGLIILSGSAPGRSWSAPVRLIDVMRGAIAEVEDYARVTVATQSKAAVAGSAVTDVIHLLAELIENATTLSPPFTQVRVSGDGVANGFAIEIEDRGLGMTPTRMAELNERLANPPDINPANTEQLGLFVVGQLARRHGIRVMLRQSPFGGTTAVVLIPLRLIVDEGPAAITAGDSWAVPAGARSAGAGPADTGPIPAVPGGARPGFARRAPIAPNGSPNGRGYGAMNGSYESNGSPDVYGGSYTDSYAGPHAGSQGSNGGGERGGDGSSHRDYRDYRDGAFPGFPPPAPAAGAPAASGAPAEAGAPADGGAGGADRGAPHQGLRGRHSTSDVPVVTGVPISREVVSPDSSFDVFSPRRRTGADGGTAPGGPADAPYERPYTGHGGVSQPQAPYADGGYGNNSGSEGGSPDWNPAGGGAEDHKGLPRRVRQANLAPQLRSSAAAGPGSTGVPQATAPSPADMRNTLSAMQRGWQQGRSQSRRQTGERDTEGNADGY
jgi:signal transduction histidine kinase